MTQIAMPDSDLITVLRKAGQLQNLVLCLDAGDELSLPAAPTKWLDRSGGGYDFFLGATAAAEGSDPGVWGTAGLRSVDNFLYFGGSQLLTYDAANEAWMANIHKDNAKFTLAAWIAPGFVLGTDQNILGTNGGDLAKVGFLWSLNGPGQLNLQIMRGVGGTWAYSSVSTAVAVVDKWQFVSVTVDEAANQCTYTLDGVSETVACTYSSPSAAAASHILQIGANGNSGGPLNIDSRLHGVFAWERALSPAELLVIRHATQPKFTRRSSFYLPISRTAGTNIGNLITNGGLAAAFDGVTSQASAACAAVAGVSGYIGKTLASPKYFGRALIYGGNNIGFCNNNPTTTINIRGKQGAAPSSGSNGTIVGTVTFTDTSNEGVSGRTIYTTDNVTLWDHLWAEIIGSGGAAIYCAELLLYEWEWG